MEVLKTDKNLKFSLSDFFDTSTNYVLFILLHFKTTSLVIRCILVRFILKLCIYHLHLFACRRGAISPDRQLMLVVALLYDFK